MRNLSLEHVHVHLQYLPRCEHFEILYMNKTIEVSKPKHCIPSLNVSSFCSGYLVSFMLLHIEFSYLCSDPAQLTEHHE